MNKLLSSFIYRFKIPRLRTVHIEPTNACNLNCAICYSQHPAVFPPRPQGLMEWPLFKKIIDELSACKDAVDLGLNLDGESLLHPNFVDMIRYAKERNLFVGFTTNGTLFDEKVQNACIKSNVDQVIFSLDGTGDDHEAARAGSNYELVKKNIISFVDKRGDKSKTRISVNVTQYRQDPGQIQRLITEWLPPVDEVAIYPALNEELQFMNPEFFAEAETSRCEVCLWPFYYMAILWNGDVTTCCPDINGVNVLGSVKSSSIGAIWAGKKYKSIRQRMVNGNYQMLQLCNKCEYWKVRFTNRSVLRDAFKIDYNNIGKRISRVV